TCRRLRQADRFGSSMRSNKIVDCTVVQRERERSHIFHHIPFSKICFCYAINNMYNQPMSLCGKIMEVLSPVERKFFAKLKTPQKVQDYLDTLPVNFELGGETYMSPRRT